MPKRVWNLKSLKFESVGEGGGGWETLYIILCISLAKCKVIQF